MEFQKSEREMHLQNANKCLSSWEKGAEKRAKAKIISASYY